MYPRDINGRVRLQAIRGKYVLVFFSKFVLMYLVVINIIDINIIFRINMIKQEFINTFLDDILELILLLIDIIILKLAIDIRRE